AALQKGPKVFQAVSVDIAFHVGHSMVNNLLGGILVKPVIAAQIIAIEIGASLCIVLYQGVRFGFPISRNHLRHEPAATLQNSSHACLPFWTWGLPLAFPPGLPTVPGGKVGEVAQAEGARARKRLLADYAAGL